MGDSQIFPYRGKDQGSQYAFVIPRQLRRRVQQAHGALDDVATEQGSGGKEIGA